MKKVLLLGATGMLGSAVYKVLRDKYDLTVTARDTAKLGLLGSSTAYLEFDAEKVMTDYKTKSSVYFSRFAKDAGDVDYVINAIGVTIPFALRDPGATFFVNSAFPHVLARHYGPRLIHITTDCVYSGTDGGAPYDERSPRSPNDIYGLSKSLGEPTECFTIRTSIIGPELSGHTGLLGWFLANAKPGASLNGFTDHLWNGITTRQFGVVCDRIMSEERLGHGLFHVFTGPVSKYEMLLAFKERFNLQCEIKPVSGNPVVRTLSTVHKFNDWLEIPTFQKMVVEI